MNVPLSRSNLITEIQSANNSILACVKSEKQARIVTLLDKSKFRPTVGYDSESWVSSQNVNYKIFLRPFENVLAQLVSIFFLLRILSGEKQHNSHKTTTCAQK